MPSSDQQVRATRTPKTERLEARVTPHLKELLQQAADLAGLSLTDFLTVSAQRAAEETIRNARVITLTARDSQHFAEALLTPPPPSARMRAAFARHAEVVEPGE